jgi:thioredoxin 1
MKSDKKVIYLGASWCGPCKTMKPVVESFRKEGHVISYVDIDQEYQVAQQLRITSVPTFVLMSGDEEIKRHVGTMSPVQFKSFLD